jgi:hypothetical protein
VDDEPDMTSLFKQMISPSFEREYNLQYLGGIGNVFHTKDIDAAIEKGNLNDPETLNVYSQKMHGYRSCIW